MTAVALCSTPDGILHIPSHVALGRCAFRSCNVTLHVARNTRNEPRASERTVRSEPNSRHMQPLLHGSTAYCRTLRNV